MRARLHRFLHTSDDDSGIVAQAPPVAAARIVRAFWPFARPYKRWIVLGLALLLVVPALDALEIYLFSRVVDDVLVPQELAPLLVIALVYLGLWFAGAIASFADEYVATWVGERFLLDLRSTVYAHIQKLGPGQRRVGDLMSRLTGDVNAIERFVLSALGEGFSCIARIIIFAGALFLLSWKLALACFVVAPLFFFLARSFGRLIKGAAREKRRRTGSLSAVAEESLNASELTLTLGREDAEVARFQRENAAIMDAEMAATRITGLYTPIAGLIELVGGMLVLALGVWALQSGDLTLGQLMAFLAYLAQLYSPIRSLGNMSNDLFAAAAGAERVLELLDEPPAVADAAHARPLPRPVRGHIEVRGISFTHRDAEGPALHDLSLRVRPGEIVAVTGPSGAGKSTLARLLLRLADPQEGRILIDGHDLRDVTLRSLREHVGLLLQDTHLPDLPAAEAIGQGRATAGREAIEAAARAAGVHEVIAALPEGYDTRIGPGGSRLSGGQRRRLAIARAYLRDTPVLVLDEPTTGLDEAARDRLLGPLRDLTKGRTAIIISHDPAVVAWADRVIVLDPLRGSSIGTSLREVPARGEPAS